MHGLMLLVLGADIEKLDQCTSGVWLDAVQQALKELKRQHSVIVLVGYSLGGALALNAALEQRRQVVQPPMAGNENLLSPP